MQHFRLLRADEIDARVAMVKKTGCSVLLYKDARVDQNILDETFGMFGWQRHHEIIGGNLYCTVAVKDPETGEWVEKQDVGTESNTEKEKGQASDSFKRACFNFGIGRELYTAPFIWIPAGKFNLQQDNGRFYTYDRFAVQTIEYNDAGTISFLEIVNHSNRDEVVFTYGRRNAQNAAESRQDAQANKCAPTPEKPTDGAQNEPHRRQVDPEHPISDKQVLTLKMMCKRHEMPESMIFEKYGHKDLTEMTIGDWVDFGHTGNVMLQEWDKKRTA